MNKTKLKEVSHIWYKDEKEEVEVRDRADAIERGVNKILAGEIDSFTIREETTFKKVGKR